MKPVRIEFCPKASAGHSARVLWLLLGGVVVLAMSGITLGTVFAEKAQERLMQASSLQAQRVSITDAAQRQERVSADVVESVNSAIRMLDYPVIELLSQLERHVRPEISVIGIEMGAVRTNLRILVQAESAPLVLDYIESIRNEPDFRRVALTRQEAASGTDGQTGWRFTLEVPQVEAVQRASARVPRGQEG